MKADKDEKEPTTKRKDRCRRCGRKLKNKDSIGVGFGPVCYKKYLAETERKPLFKVWGDL